MDRSPVMLRNTKRTRPSSGSGAVLRWPVPERYVTNWPHPCFVMPARRASSVTLMPSGGTAAITRTWDMRRSPRVPSDSSARIRPKRPAISSGSTSSRPALINSLYYLGAAPRLDPVPAHVDSVNLGTREPNPAKTVGVTGIRKRPVDAATLRAPGPKRGGLGSGLVDDFIGDVRHHDGDLQAVYAFAREELDFWAGRLGVELANGSFGENLTTLGLDVDASLVGDRWAVGDEVVLEVTGPRIPCATFAARMGIRGWVRTFAAEARSGAYLAVVTGGEVRPGDEVRVVARPGHDVD